MTARTIPQRPHRAPPRRTGDAQRDRARVILCALLLGFLLIAGQLVRLAVKAPAEFKLSLAEPMAKSWARPDIIDRQGRLLATDVATHSLYADPQLVQDVDEAIEKFTAALPALDGAELRKTLSDKSRRFAWVARGLTPRQAQEVHALGVPGFALRAEPKRVYPLGRLTGHVLGTVNTDNRGIAGIERMLDDSNRAEAVQGPARATAEPVRLSLDVGVQHALAEELKQACVRYSASAAAGVVLDAGSGEILGAASLPEADPARPMDWLDGQRVDRLAGGSFELGSVFKLLTLAMALDMGIADLDRVYDVREPLVAGPYAIKDPYPQGRPLSVREIFVHSSNVGAGMLALETGAERQRAFLDRLGLTEPARTEAGPMAAPQLPKRWGRIETITVGYGHGLAVAPLQFAAAVAALVNGGLKVAPTLLMASRAAVRPERVVTEATSAKLREVMRLNVTNAHGTGRYADADGYRVGGKTGTAEMPGRGGYREKSVISSFAGAFPMDAPRYVVLVLLFEPKTGEGRGHHITAAVNAAPTTARVVERIAPLLGIVPRREGA
ncbi:MAG: penicillin-binding protein 2 [Hyphomicrobiaceae bacterium]|nr:penicillin-binding protein 2 [Hyphomicrobiaceae bacterium]